MSQDNRARLVEFVRQRIITHRPPSMHVDWFGGEPLLAPKVLEELSDAFVRICDEYQIAYRAQVITNGTAFTSKSVDLLRRARVDRIQVSIDGPRQVHDARRPFKSNSARSSYDAIVDRLDFVVRRFIVRLRINVDQHNLGSVMELLDAFDAKGWLGPDTQFFPYLERVSPFTEASAHVMDSIVPMHDFMHAQFQWLNALREKGVPVVEQGIYRFPSRRAYNCGAVGANGFLVTSEGEIHKCGLEIDDSTKAVGHLASGIDEQNRNFLRYKRYSPFEDAMCRECEFLPTCLGGCPRSRLESRQQAIRDNCTYYKKFELAIVKAHLAIPKTPKGSQKRFTKERA